MPQQLEMDKQLATRLVTIFVSRLVVEAQAEAGKHRVLSSGNSMKPIVSVNLKPF
jgi:hypothetical protein